MAEETKTPAVMPWQENWELKPRQIVNDVIEKATTALEGVKTGKMPWDMDWKVKPRKEASSPVPVAPTKVDVSTEAKMKKAAVILPSERQPDSSTDLSNLAEIEKEIKNTKVPSILAILNAEKEKILRKSTHTQNKNPSAQEIYDTQMGIDKGKMRMDILKRAVDVPEYAELSSFLMDRRAMPTLEVGGTSSEGSFSTPTGWGQTPVQSNGTIEMALNNWFTDKTPTPEALNTLTHEMTHAADKQLQKLYGELNRKKNSLTPTEQQFYDTWSKLEWPDKDKQGHMAAFAEVIAKTIAKKWYDENRDYRSTDGELKAFAVGDASSKKNYGTPAHINSTIATTFRQALALAAKVAKEHNSNSQGR